MTSWILILIFFLLIRIDESEQLAVDDGNGNDLLGMALTDKREKRQIADPEPKISSYHITSSVISRYATTSVDVTFVNEAAVTQVARFNYNLGRDALISGFLITIDGVPYRSQVQEKEGPRAATYRGPRGRVLSEARVRHAEFEDSQFIVELNMKAGETAVFHLTFQELLKRDKGQYRQEISVAPGKVIDDVRVEVNIMEPQGLQWVHALWTPSDPSISPLVSFTPSSTEASILLSLSRDTQSKTFPTRRIHGFIEVTYDVQHSLDGGDLQVMNGYFVHHISPEGLPVAPKRVIFLIDVSTSMRGVKLTQTKTAMIHILGQLRDIDYFNVMTYSYGVRKWKRRAVPATPVNIAIAQHFVRNIRANGGTNIHSPLISAAHQFDDSDDAFPVIVFMTDGRPNIGLTRTSDIVGAVKRATRDKVAIYTIGFGDDVDGDLLERLANGNHGKYYQIDEDHSPSLQMRGFFEEIATPLLYNIEIDYLDDAVEKDSLTAQNFISYFDGEELLVAGKLSDGYSGENLTAVISAWGKDGRVVLPVSAEMDEGNVPDDLAQRLWAYVTIQDILERERIVTSPVEQTSLRHRALDLSLENSFVSPLTVLRVAGPLVRTLPTTPAPTLGTNVDPQPLTPIQSGRIHPQSLQDSKVELREQTKPSTSRVGADPHFIIDIPHTNLTICFDLQAEDGRVINLISDPALDIYVNAGISPVEDTTQSSELKQKGSPSSIISHLGFELGHHKILVTPIRVMVDFEIEMLWGTSKTIVIGDYKISVEGKQNFTILIGDVIQMSVKLRNHWPNHPDHLDFTIVTNDGFSRSVHGLLGQFQNKNVILKKSAHDISKDGHLRSVMNIEGDDKFVFKMVETIITRYECWWAQPETYIDGTATDYFVSGYFSRFRRMTS